MRHTKHTPQTKFNKKKVAALDRWHNAWNLRIKGYSFAQIAKELGFKNPSGAYWAVSKYAETLKIEDSEELQKLMFEQLRELYKKSVSLEDLGSRQECRKLIESMANMMGLITEKKDITSNGETIKVIVGLDESKL